MSLDDILQLLILLIVMGGGFIVQIFQAGKRTRRRQKSPKRPVSTGGPQASPTEDDIGRKVRELLERAAGRREPEPPPPKEPPKVEPRVQTGPEVPESIFSGGKGSGEDFQVAGREMGGSFKVFPPSGISEGPGRGGGRRKKKKGLRPGAAEEAPAAGPPSSTLLPLRGKVDAASLAAFLASRPDLAVLGYEILGPPPALRERPPSWEWW